MFCPYNAALCNLAWDINFLACLFAPRGTMENSKKHDEKFVQKGWKRWREGLMTCSRFPGHFFPD